MTQIYTFKTHIFLTIKTFWQKPDHFWTVLAKKSGFGPKSGFPDLVGRTAEVLKSGVIWTKFRNLEFYVKQKSHKKPTNVQEYQEKYVKFLCNWVYIFSSENFLA